MESRPFYLDELLADTSRAASILAASKNIRVELPALPEASCYGDEDLVRRMFMNMLENAVKYTEPQGRIWASIHIVGDRAAVEIHDRGIGIPPADIPHIFDRFYRVDKARSRDEGGFGLGLAIAKSIAEMHGAELSVESKEGHGSSFRVLFPAAASTIESKEATADFSASFQE